MALHALQNGYMLSEYKIEKLLGEGGFGLTYLAFDTNLEKKVAIKEYMPSEHAIRKDDSQILAKSESSEKVYSWGLNAFLNEAKTLAKYEDKNIVRIYRFFKANGTAYIVMEYCEGGCLIDRISKNVNMEESVLQSIISPIIHGLQLVHNDGILHRDIKPENIMFRHDGTPVLIDFGAARQAIGQKSHKVTTIITPGYAPLEQYSSKGSLGPWSDIYSLAAVAYLCLTGERPPDIMNRLHKDTISKLGNKNNSSPFLKSVDAGLNLQVDDRPQSLSEWSYAWTNITLDKEQKHDKVQQPIFASKPSSPSDEDYIPRPISARTSFEANDQTIVNIDNFELKNKTKRGISFFRIISTVFMITILTVGSFFAYEYYSEQQKAKKKIVTQQKNEEKVKKIEVKLKKESVTQVQQILNKLGYTVPEDGSLDTRTIESIKAFEKDNQLIVTGSVDDILLTELNKIFNQKDNLAWQKAILINTPLSYQAYIANNPNGLHNNKVPKLIQQLEEEIQNRKIAENKKIAINIKEEKQRLTLITSEKSQLIIDIKQQLKRLKFKDILISGELDKDTKSYIISYQKYRKIDANGLPTKTLLFKLKSESNWPGYLIGQTIKDCQFCPEMVVIPQGSYLMGSDFGKKNEQPKHNVSISEFAISKTEITFKQWDACEIQGFCTHKPNDTQSERELSAVMLVNWDDAQQYTNWLSNISNKTYRLPSEAEWEYATRAGTSTKYSWGNDIGSNNVSCKGCNSTVNNNNLFKIKEYQANAYGLYDMHGNVWEWTADCWHYDYMGAPSDNEAWEPNDCSKFVVRGGSGGNTPEELRSASRGAMDSSKRLNSLGFRVVLDIQP